MKRPPIMPRALLLVHEAHLLELNIVRLQKYADHPMLKQHNLNHLTTKATRRFYRRFNQLEGMK